MRQFLIGYNMPALRIRVMRIELYYKNISTLERLVTKIDTKQMWGQT